MTIIPRRQGIFIAYRKESWQRQLILPTLTLTNCYNLPHLQEATSEDHMTGGFMGSI
jgi:hypothetical protein